MARVAVRLETEADRALLPDLGRAAAAQLDVRVIGRGAGPLLPHARRAAARVRPLRPGLSVAHPTVTAGTLGGFVRVGGRLAILSNNHVLAASDAARDRRRRPPARTGRRRHDAATGWPR